MFMVQNQTVLDQDILYPCSYEITAEYPVKANFTENLQTSYNNKMKLHLIEEAKFITGFYIFWIEERKGRMIETNGYAAKQIKECLTPYSFQRRNLLADDVLIDIQYCGICHSDIHQVRNEWGPSIFPMVPGHEIVGTVSQKGANVTQYKVGDRVAVGNFVDSCGQCNPCLNGLEQYCVKGPTWTYNAMITENGKLVPTQGGYSDKIVVKEKYVLRIPDNLSLAASAPLLCAGITLYSPLIHWKAGPGKKVGIIGLGGIGHIGVKIADALGAEVTVLSHSLTKQDEALKMGADSFYPTSDSSSFKRLRGYFDLIINTVSIQIDLNKYLKLLNRDGTMVIVGLPEKEMQFNAFSLTSARRSIAGSVVGGIRETQEMLNFCSEQNITCNIELIPIQQVNEAYERVVRSEVRYRFVIDILNSLRAKN